jgi:tetratricopeptide (TPR) repeat protein
MTDEWHLDEGAAVGLVVNGLTVQERRRAVRHLLAGCGSCRELVRKAAFESKELEGPGTELFGRLDEARLITSELIHTFDDAMGPLLWAKVEQAPPAQRLRVVKRERRYHTYSVFQAALQAVRKRAARDPQAAVELAHVALALAELADPEVSLAAELRFDWRANALVSLAHAQKTAGDFRAAQSVLDLADTYLSCGTQDPVDRAMFFVGKAGLFYDLGRFEEAVEILDRAASLFRRVEDRNGAGKALIQQAAVLQYINPARGLDVVEEGLAMIDLDAEPRAEWAGRHAQAYCCNELEEPEEAEGILETYRYLSNRFPDFEVQGSREWLHARVCARLDRTAEAEHRFREVRSGYLERGFRQEAVLTSVDLAELVAHQGRTGEALHIAQELFPILQAWGLHRDTLTLMAFLAENLQRDAVKADLFFREVTEQLRRTWHQNVAGSKG